MDRPITHCSSGFLPLADLGSGVLQQCIEFRPAFRWSVAGLSLSLPPSPMQCGSTLNRVVYSSSRTRLSLANLHHVHIASLAALSHDPVPRGPFPG